MRGIILFFGLLTWLLLMLLGAWAIQRYVIKGDGPPRKRNRKAKAADYEEKFGNTDWRKETPPSATGKKV